jgi:hypothetical protein
MQVDTVGKWLLYVGIGLAVIGGLLILASRVPVLNQLGRLPGDIRYENPDGRFSCFVPIVSMILVSLILTVVLNVVVRLLNR